jgi:hypothetical protein
MNRVAGRRRQNHPLQAEYCTLRHAVPVGASLFRPNQEWWGFQYVHERAFGRRKRAVTFVGGTTRALTIQLGIDDFEPLERLAVEQNVGNGTLEARLFADILTGNCRVDCPAAQRQHDEQAEAAARVNARSTRHDPLR